MNFFIQELLFTFIFSVSLITPTRAKNLKTMYNFIYYFMYKLQLKFVAHDEAKLNGVFAVTLSVFFQIFMILNLIRYFFNVDVVFKFLKHAEHRNLIVVSFGILLIISCFLIYKKKYADKLIGEFDNRIENIFSIKYILLFFLLTLGTLILAIYLSIENQKKYGI